MSIPSTESEQKRARRNLRYCWSWENRICAVLFLFLATVVGLYLAIATVTTGLPFLRGELGIGFYLSFLMPVVFLSLLSALAMLGLLLYLEIERISTHFYRFVLVWGILVFACSYYALLGFYTI